MSIQFFAPRGTDNEIMRLPSSYRRKVKWLPRIGDIFPNFSVESTEGRLQFWDWAEGSWVYLFSHPAANTSVCTTELAALAAYSGVWKARNVKLLSLSCSSIEELSSWHRDISDVFGVEVDFPSASDPKAKIASLCGMIHESESLFCPIRKSFLIDPSMHIRSIMEYPSNIGRSTQEIVRVLDALQNNASSGMATPADWEDGDPMIIPDDWSEMQVFKTFGKLSERVTSYLRVISFD